MSRMLLAAALLAALLAPPPIGAAQSRGGGGGSERAFIEELRRGDPAAAERYVALRDAREKAIAELRRVEAQYGAAGRELRPVFLPQVKQARQAYAETSLALLDFLDARDRQAVAGYREAIGRIDALLEARQRTRAELQKLLAEP